MNPNQLSTEEQAATTAQQIGTIGGGVRETYVINPTITPDFRHYKLGNGATGVNAGLCRVTIQNNPGTWEKMLAEDFARAAQGSPEE